MRIQEVKEALSILLNDIKKCDDKNAETFLSILEKVDADIA